MTNGCDEEDCVEPARYYHVNVVYDDEDEIYYTCPEHACLNCVEIT